MTGPAYDPRACGARCDECPLRDHSPVPPSGNPDASMVVVGDSPGKFEVQHSRIFIGPAGVKLDEVLYRAGIPSKAVWKTHAILCRPEVPEASGRKRFDVKNYIAWMRRENKTRSTRNRADPKGPQMPLMRNPFECCAPRLQAELARAEQVALTQGKPNGSVVLPLGPYSLAVVQGEVGKSHSITKYRGSVIPGNPNPNTGIAP